MPKQVMFIIFIAVIILAGLQILEYLVCVVTRRRAVFVALTVFSGALVVQKAFGMAALTQMGEIAAGVDKTTGVGAVI